MSKGGGPGLARRLGPGVQVLVVLREDDRALACLRAAVVDRGTLASTSDQSNYRRIWTRDSVICGLAGYALADEGLLEALGASLHSLASQLGPGGLVPSNVAADDESAASYGGLAGRVDAGAWFVIGACHFLEARPDDRRRALFVEVIEGALQLYQHWELNAGGLVNVPMGGSWADEYPIHGYTLTEQLLRLWALRLAAATLQIPELAQQAERIQGLVETNYWIQIDADSSRRYHPIAYGREQARGPSKHWQASLSPGGYQGVFDTLANSLAVLLGIGNSQQREQTLDYGQSLHPGRMLPAYWPAIEASDPQWDDLQGLARHGFRNHPGEYHNGGQWPMVNGFWGAALCSMDRTREASALLEAVCAANATESQSLDFFEFHAAETGPKGTPRCTWSAAGQILLDRALHGSPLNFGALAPPPGGHS